MESARKWDSGHEKLRMANCRWREPFKCSCLCHVQLLVAEFKVQPRKVCIYCYLDGIVNIFLAQTEHE